MDDERDFRLKRLDILAKIFLGIVGASLTTILGCQQHRMTIQMNELQHATSIQQQKESADQQRAQFALAQQQSEASTLELVLRHLSLINKPGLEGQQAHQIVLKGAKWLSEKYGNPFMALVVQELEVPKTPSEALQVGESTDPEPTGARWFAVLASFRESEKAPADKFARSLAIRLGNAYSVEIYKTRISRNLAVTIGGPSERSRATDLAAEARHGGWASDAFVQVDRGWTRVP
jgi:hypothetical protein